MQFKAAYNYSSDNLFTAKQLVEFINNTPFIEGARVGARQNTSTSFSVIKGNYWHHYKVDNFGNVRYLFSSAIDLARALVKKENLRVMGGQYILQELEYFLESDFENK